MKTKKRSGLKKLMGYCGFFAGLAVALGIGVFSICKGGVKDAMSSLSKNQTYVEID